MTDQAVNCRCECTPVLETRFGGEGDRLPSVAVVEAVAAAEDVAPAELDPMYDEVDPEAIDQLFTGRSDGRPSAILRFSVAGWRVFVRGDGAIRVCDPDRPSDRAPAFEKAISD